MFQTEDAHEGEELCEEDVAESTTVDEELQNTIDAVDINNGEENSRNTEMTTSGDTKDFTAVTEDSCKFISPN